MATLASMVSTLKEVANISANDRITDDRLGAFISQAVVQHNPLYTLSTLPVREEEPVLTLAWIKVCLKRAIIGRRDGRAGDGGCPRRRLIRCVCLPWH